MDDTASVKRVLILVSFANIGGAQIAALRVAAGLAERGYDVTVRFLYQRAPVNSNDYPSDVIWKDGLPGIGGYLRLVPALFRFIRYRQPDVVLTFMPLACVLGQLCAAIAGVRRRVISHRVPVNTISPVLRLIDLIWAWLGVYTRVICVSSAVKDSCRHYPAALFARTDVVHNGLRNFRASNLDRAQARAKFGVSDNQLALVAIGRLAEQKNYPLMIRLVAQLDNVMLLIAGDGPLRSAIETSIDRCGLSGKVQILGNLPRGDIPDLLAAADLFLQTSLFEGQSNTVLEALAAGVPMILHDIPEQRETIAEDGSGEIAGALVPVSDQAAWLAAIESYRHDPGRVEATRAVARRRTALFTYERMIEGFESSLTA